MADAKALRLKIDALRSEIADLQAKRHAAETAPLAAAQASQRLAGLINQGAQRYVARGSFMAFASPTIQPAPGDLIPGTDEGLFDFLCAAIGDRIIEQLATLLEERCAEGLSAVERSKRLAAIDVELLKLGRSEEKLISDAERAGITIIRRSDADPAIVLEGN